jgi:hypothetical protein
MAKRGRAVSIDRLLKQLKKLDSQREALTATIRRTVGTMLESRSKGARAAVTAAAGDSNQTAEPRRRRKRTMSAAARKAISEAQKRRWAKQKQ